MVQDFEAGTYAEDKRYINDINQQFDNRTRAYPVNFVSCHRPMLQHLNEILEQDKILIHPDFKDLITALRTAYVKSDSWDLDKSKTLNDDLLDALRLACIYYRRPASRATMGNNNSPLMISIPKGYY